ncbi:amino acid/polyamine transporter I [Mucidula mucida]|nr:amino acid/polyamine transporter I [Mucidula mucida]
MVLSLVCFRCAHVICQWATCSVFLMCIALAIAELGSSAPTSGGLYYWTHKFSSPKYRNLLAWIVGYTNTITYITGILGIDYSCALQIMAGASIGTGTFVPTVYQTYGVFCAVLISHGIVASLATGVLARLQWSFIVLNITLVLIILIGLPIATPSERMNTASYTFGNFTNLTLWPSGYAFILSFLAPLWSVGGFDAGVHISEEAVNANVAVPWAIVTVTAIGCTLGFALQICVAFSMGPDTISILSDPIGQPLATILHNSFNRNTTLAVWSLIIIALWMAGSSMTMSASRQAFAFSRDGALPFSPYLYRINSRSGTPVNCVWFAVTIAGLLGLLTFAGSAATTAIFSMGVVGQYVVNSIPITARFLGPHKFVPGPFSLGIFSKPVGCIAVLWMWFMTIALLFPTEPAPTATNMNYSVVVIGGVILLSVIYFYFPKYGGVYWFNGPVANVSEDTFADVKHDREASLGRDSGTKSG